MPTLTLYYRPTCPFCVKVLRFMQKEEINIPQKNVTTNPEFRNELIHHGGKSQVPCLLIDKRPLYESDLIIEWLKENWKTDEHH